MNAEALIPPLPGDRVRSNKAIYRAEGDPLSAVFTERPIPGRIYRVRDSYADKETGQPRIRLVGIHAIADDDGQEFGFPATWFTQVGARIQPFQPSEEDRCHVPVRLPEEVFRVLEGNPVFPLFREFVNVEDGKLEVHCRRWVNSWRVSKPLRDMHADMARAVAAGPSVVCQVPLTGLELQDLAEICHHLDIESEAWLQGVLGNLARRCVRFREQYEMALRLEQKRRAKER